MGHFGPLWAIQVLSEGLGHFGPLWATLGHFGPLWATLAVWATLGHFGPLWAKIPASHHSPQNFKSTFFLGHPVFLRPATPESVDCSPVAGALGRRQTQLTCLARSLVAPHIPIFITKQHSHCVSKYFLVMFL